MTLHWHEFELFIRRSNGYLRTTNDFGLKVLLEPFDVGLCADRRQTSVICQLGNVRVLACYLGVSAKTF